MKRHVLTGRWDGYFCNILLRADLGSSKAVKGHLLLAERSQTLPGAGSSPAWVCGLEAGVQQRLATLRFQDVLFAVLLLQKSKHKFLRQGSTIPVCHPAMAADSVFHKHLVKSGALHPSGFLAAPGCISNLSSHEKLAK